MSNNQKSKGQYAVYKTQNRYATNKRKKLERALKRNPENKQIQEALKGVFSYSRKAPSTPKWSHSTKRATQLLNEVKKVKPLLTEDTSSRNWNKLKELLWNCS